MNYNEVVTEGSTREDLYTYNQLKKIKQEFDKEMKSIKTDIKSKNISDAKNKVNRCNDYIDQMDKLVNSIPDSHFNWTKISALATIVASVLSTIVCYDFRKNEFNKGLNELDAKRKENDAKIRENNSKRRENVNKYNKNNMQRRDLARRYNDINKKIDTKTDKFSKAINNKRYDQNEVIAEYRDYIIKNVKEQSGLINANRGLSSENENIRKVSSEISKNNKKLKRENDAISKQIDEKLANKKKYIGKKTDITAPTIGVAAVGTAITAATVKGVKTRARALLRRAKQQLNKISAYLDKIEKMNDEVKESFDDTLDCLYNAYIEGVVDEFEYDSLIDHLLE